ncbi:MAG: hypothetical protein NWE92_12400 [Candidatus Bathyarchaeota archaeon]|nr:hypothetical protein [Candidatus Bathyarchaeota archaeon]
MTQIQTATEDDLLVSLTFHNMPAELLKEFALKIVKPYFGGNLNEAVRSLMEKAITEETLVNAATSQTKVIFKEEAEP